MDKISLTSVLNSVHVHPRPLDCESINGNGFFQCISCLASCFLPQKKAEHSWNKSVKPSQCHLIKFKFEFVFHLSGSACLQCSRELLFLWSLSSLISLTMAFLNKNELKNQLEARCCSGSPVGLEMFTEAPRTPQPELSRGSRGNPRNYPTFHVYISHFLPCSANHSISHSSAHNINTSC